MFYNKHKLNEMTFCFINNFLISFIVYEKYSGKKIVYSRLRKHCNVHVVTVTDFAFVIFSLLLRIEDFKTIPRQHLLLVQTVSE